MQALHHFSAATCFFYQNKLEEAAASLNNCIKLKPNNPIVYSNLALIHYHMGKITESIDQLKTALQLNPANYILYFNLASIQLRQSRPESALKYLFGCISALHTVLGKLQKEPKYLISALNLCPNNVDAFLLLMLFQMNSEQYTQALNTLEYYGKYHKNALFLVKLENILLKIKEEYNEELEQEFYQILQFEQMDRQILQCEHKQSTFDVQEQIRVKINEFNQLYEIINQKLGQKVKMEPTKNEQYSISSNQVLQQSTGIYCPSLVTAHN